MKKLGIVLLSVVFVVSIVMPLFAQVTQVENDPVKTMESGAANLEKVNHSAKAFAPGQLATAEKPANMFAPGQVKKVGLAEGAEKISAKEFAPGQLKKAPAPVTPVTPVAPVTPTAPSNSTISAS